MSETLICLVVVTQRSPLRLLPRKADALTRREKEKRVSSIRATNVVVVACSGKRLEDTTTKDLFYSSAKTFQRGRELAYKKYCLLNQGLLFYFGTYVEKHLMALNCFLMYPKDKFSFCHFLPGHQSFHRSTFEGIVKDRRCQNCHLLPPRSSLFYDAINFRRLTVLCSEHG